MGASTKEVNVPVKIKVEATPIIESEHRAVKGIFKLALIKFVENLVSVKVWTIFILLGVTAFLCYVGKLTGQEFITINGGVITTVYALREGFKVAKIKKLTNGEIKNVNI